jgi:hypothetical protein
MEELELGERLALKGQLFELQKRLKIIDIENQQKEEFTFQPESYTASYPLQDREPTYTKNVERAEIMRKQRLDMLKHTLDTELQMTHTFSPEISTKSKRLQRSTDSTAFDRLYESAGTIQSNKKALAAAVSDYDPATGQKLYQPKITVKSRKIAGSAETDTNAHEYMYRDAMDREERLRQLTRKTNADLEKVASASKTNKRSMILLRQRAERETRALYDSLDIQTVGELSYDDVLRGSEIIASKGKQLHDRVYKTAQSVWEHCAADRNGGYITFEVFSKLAAPVVARKAQSATIPTPSQLEKSLQGGVGGGAPSYSPRRKLAGSGRSIGDEGAVLGTDDAYGSDDGDGGDDVTTSAYIETDEDVFKGFVTKLLEILHASKEYAKSIDISRIKQRKYAEQLKYNNEEGRGTFSPSIGATSRRLALSKEERDVTRMLLGGGSRDSSPTSMSSPRNRPRSPPIRSPAQIKQGLQLLWARTEELKQRKESKRQAQLAKEAQECTFKPRVNRDGPGTPGRGRGRDSGPNTPQGGRRVASSSHSHSRGTTPGSHTKSAVAASTVSSHNPSASEKAAKQAGVIIAVHRSRLTPAPVATPDAVSAPVPDQGVPAQVVVDSPSDKDSVADSISLTTTTTAGHAVRSLPELGHGGLKSSASSITTAGAATMASALTEGGDYASLSAANLKANKAVGGELINEGIPTRPPHLMSDRSSSNVGSHPEFTRENHSHGHASVDNDEMAFLNTVGDAEAAEEEKSEQIERMSVRSASISVQSVSSLMNMMPPPVSSALDSAAPMPPLAPNSKEEEQQQQQQQQQHLQEIEERETSEFIPDADSEDEYEYFDEHGNRIDPADIKDHHIIVDETDVPEDNSKYTEAELAGIAAQKNYIRQLNHLPVSERLYAQRNLHKPPRVKYRGKKVIEVVALDDCTFKPSIQPYHPPGHVTGAEDVPLPTGWDESINRMRTAAGKRRAKLREEEEEHERREIAYQKSRELSAQGQNPFKFSSDVRVKKIMKQREEEKKVKPRLYVDVRLSKTKTINIALHDGDDPEVMAARFCKIYGLNVKSKDILEEVIRQSMEVNDITIINQKGEKERRQKQDAYNKARRMSQGDGWLSSSDEDNDDEDRDPRTPRDRKRKDHHHRKYERRTAMAVQSELDAAEAQATADDGDGEGKQQGPLDARDLLGDGGAEGNFFRDVDGGSRSNSRNNSRSNSRHGSDAESASGVSSYTGESDSDSSIDETPLYASK